MGAQRRYRARAKTWGLGETDKGTEQVAVEFEILTENAEMNHIVWYGYFSEKTWERTVESLRACGWEGADLTDLQGLEKNEVELVIEDEEYNGNPVAKVRWVNRPGGLALKAPLTGERARSFAATMREQIKAMDAAGGRKPAPKAAAKPKQAPQMDEKHFAFGAEAPAHTDDDIPF